MISSLSRLLTVQLSPLLVVLSICLLFVTLMCPVPIPHTAVSLAKIVPGVANRQLAARSTLLVDAGVLGVGGELLRKLPRSAVPLLARAPAAAASSGNGPAWVFGLLGSCYKAKPDGPMNCTAALVNPRYNLSALPKSTLFISSPPQTSPHWLILSLCLLFVFLLLLILPFVPRMPARVVKAADKPIYGRINAWIGIIGWIGGMAVVIVMRITFGNAADSFNAEAIAKGVQLVAVLGEGFTLLWVAYALAVPCLICSLFKLQLDAKKSG